MHPSAILPARFAVQIHFLIPFVMLNIHTMLSQKYVTDKITGTDGSGAASSRIMDGGDAVLFQRQNYFTKDVTASSLSGHCTVLIR